MMFKKSKILAILAIVTTICSFRAEAATETRDPYATSHYLKQSMRSDNWRGTLIAERMRGNKDVDKVSMRDSLWKIVPQMLHDFGTSTGWFAPELKNSDGTINFGNVSGFSDAQKRYVILANALASDNRNADDVSRRLNRFYGAQYFDASLAKEAQEYIDFGLMEEMVKGWRVGNTEVIADEIETRIKDGNYLIKKDTTPITDTKAYSFSREERPDPSNPLVMRNTYSPQFNEYMESTMISTYPDGKTFPDEHPKTVRYPTDSGDEDEEDLTSAPAERVKPTTSGMLPQTSSRNSYAENLVVKLTEDYIRINGYDFEYDGAYRLIIPERKLNLSTEKLEADLKNLAPKIGLDPESIWSHTSIRLGNKPSEYKVAYRHFGCNVVTDIQTFNKDTFSKWLNFVKKEKEYIKSEVTEDSYAGLNENNVVIQVDSVSDNTTKNDSEDYINMMNAFADRLSDPGLREALEESDSIRICLVAGSDIEFTKKNWKTFKEAFSRLIHVAPELEDAEIEYTFMGVNLSYSQLKELDNMRKRLDVKYSFNN